jgi:uncharacterized membrane protein YhhN
VIVGALTTIVGVIGLLVAEFTGRPWLRWIAKPVASAGYLLAALGAPMLRMPTGSGWLLLAALALSAAGDVLLVPHGKRAFAAGLAAFAFAHVVYGAWFVTHGVTWWVLLPVGLAFLAVAHAVWMWIKPNLAEQELLPVRTYIAVVSLMAACATAFGVWVISSAPEQSLAELAPALLPALGGVALYASDFAVARHRFVAPALINRAWGLPVYYLGQILIASALS